MGRRRSRGRTIDTRHEAVALATVLGTLIQYIHLSTILMIRVITQGLGIACTGIMFMMHGIEHQHVSADDQQQCPDQ